MPRNNASLAAITPKDMVRITASLLFQGQRLQTSFDYLSRAAVGDPNAASVGFQAAWEAAFATLYAGTLGTDVTIEKYNVAFLSRNDIISRESPAAVEMVGTVASLSNPSTMAFIFSKYTLTRGQHGHGRNYLGPIPVSFITPATDPDRVNAAGLTAYAAFYGPLLTTPVVSGGSTFDLAIGTRPTPPATTVSRGEVVARMVPRALIGTSRRRLEGRGQ